MAASVPPDGGPGTQVTEVPAAVSIALAKGPSDVGVLYRVADGGLWFTRVSPTGVFRQSAPTAIAPVAVQPTPALVWDGLRYRAGFSDTPTNQPWTASISALGVVESLEPLGCDLTTIWNEPRLAVVDTGLVVGTFANELESGVVRLP